MFGVGATAPGLVPILGPQIPASLFALAMLARSGPLLAVAPLFGTPAEALAVDQRDPKASLPVVVGLEAGFLRDAAEVEEAYEGCCGVEKVGFDENALDDVAGAVLMDDCTEV